MKYFVPLPKIYLLNMKKVLFTVLSAVILTSACGNRQHKEAPSEVISTQQNEPGDSTRYGLACDGCTDSLLIFLPYEGGDPDTFDIVSAQEQQRIYGRPHIGDDMAVVLSADSVVMAINLSTLRNTWCYEAEPKLRRLAAQHMKPLPDSIMRTIMTPREYGFQLKRDHSVRTIGIYRRDNMSPVEYPQVTFYKDWRIWNGRLILHADTVRGLGKEDIMPQTDTADICLLMRDSLVLRFRDHDQSYYRKKTEE